MVTICDAQLPDPDQPLSTEVELLHSAVGLPGQNTSNFSLSIATTECPAQRIPRGSVPFFTAIEHSGHLRYSGDNFKSRGETKTAWPF